MLAQSTSCGNDAVSKPTIIILTYCEHPSLEYGALMVFDTLRVGFPTFDVVVIDNGSHQEVVPKIAQAAKKVGARFMPTERHDFVDHYRWVLCEQQQIDSVILLDPDVVFWENIEHWSFNGLIAGRLIPDLPKGNLTSVARIHPSLVWVPSVKKLRDVGATVEICQKGNYFYDTLATIYQKHADKCDVFTEKHLDCYDHLFYGSHFPAVEPCLSDGGLTYSAHKNAACGDLLSLKGIWRQQEEHFKNPQFAASQSVKTIHNRMIDVCESLALLQNVTSENAVRDLLVNINSQLPEATKTMLQMPQADCPVIHHFGPNLCVREVFMPAGTFAIGHRQKFEHMNVMLRGKVMVVNDDGTTNVLSAPMMFIGKPGRKVGYVIEDMVWQNIYATDLKNPDDVEAHFIEKSEDWREDYVTKLAVAQVEREMDRADYEAVALLSGFTKEQIRQQVENDDDLIWIDSAITRVSESPIHGKGLFLTHSVKEGDVICASRINGKRTQAGRYTNHSMKPNAKMVMRANGDVDLVSTCEIKGCVGGNIGTEITIDYRQALELSGVRLKNEVIV